MQRVTYATRLRQIIELREKGLITEQELREIRQRILGGLLECYFFKEFIMKLEKMCLGAAVMVALGMSSVASAAPNGEALIKKSGCLACHSVDKKVVGPAYKDVAKKYAGNAGAPARLVEKVKKGGKGVWGSTAMPPQKGHSDADLKAMVAWVLSRR